MRLASYRGALLRDTGHEIRTAGGHASAGIAFETACDFVHRGLVVIRIKQVPVRRRVLTASHWRPRPAVAIEPSLCPLSPENGISRMSAGDFRDLGGPLGPCATRRL